MKNSVCPICGQPTSSYMGHERKDGLCRKHASELKEGKIELRPYKGLMRVYQWRLLCGLWFSNIRLIT